MTIYVILYYHMTTMNLTSDSTEECKEVFAQILVCTPVLSLSKLIMPTFLSFMWVEMAVWPSFFIYGALKFY
jgi:hypothetical protein